MDQATALEIGNQAMQVGLSILLPILSVALFSGVVVSVFQALTQIQEPTLTFVPKLLGVAAVLALMGQWMLSTLANFMSACLQQAMNVTRPV